MTDNEFIVLYDYIYKVARYYKKWWPHDWELLVTAAFEAINKDMPFPDAQCKARNAINTLQVAWRRAKYTEPGDLVNPETGEEKEICESERLEAIIRLCPICGKELNNRQKACSRLCKDRLYNQKR